MYAWMLRDRTWTFADAQICKLTSERQKSTFTYANFVTLSYVWKIQ